MIFFSRSNVHNPLTDEKINFFIFFSEAFNISLTWEHYLHSWETCNKKNSEVQIFKNEKNLEIPAVSWLMVN
jgi:hypothetical protein